MDKHTPGPWSTYLNTADDMVVRKMFPDGQEAHPIARVQSPNAIRDARLIAAAPDLLAVAQWARDAMRQAFDEVLQTIPEGGAVPSWMATLETTIVDAERAIAKATGEATC